MTYLLWIVGAVIAVIVLVVFIFIMWFLINNLYDRWRYRP